MDKMREEFEAWWISKNPNNADVGLYWHETGYWVNSNSAYSNLDFAWKCWKASRAALCVELPCGYIGHPYRFDILSAVDDCRLALEDAGIEYK